MLWFAKFIFCFWIGHCFSFLFSVLELGLSSWFFFLFDLDFPLDDCFRFWMLVWISGFLVLDLNFGFGFWIWISDLDFGFGLDFDWIFIWFFVTVVGYGLCLARGESLCPNVVNWLIQVVEYGLCSAKGSEWPGFGLGLRPLIIDYHFRSLSMDYAQQGSEATRIRLRT